jgi:glycosyltransferase involved in cell wall biosynthesis
VECRRSTPGHLAGPDPYSVFYCASVAAALRDVIRRSAPDAVIVSDLRLHRYLDAAREAGVDRVAIDLHNREADLYAELIGYMYRHGFGPEDIDRFAGSLGVQPPVDGGTLAAITAVERHACQVSVAVSAVSTVDASCFAERYGLSGVYVVPNSVQMAAVPAAPLLVRDGPVSLLFLGVLDYLPNAVAALSLVREIFPAVAAAYPDARLTIAGRNPQPELRDAIADSRIRLLANPADPRPLLPGSIFVVPVELGGGTRLKILEAFRAGASVVSTEKGVEGLEVTAGTHYLAAASPADYVAAVDHIVRNGAADLARREVAFDLAASVYSWEAIRAPVARLVHDLLR